MKTIDEVIEYVAEREYRSDLMRDYEMHEIWVSILDYLHKFRDCRHLLQTDRIVAYWGPLPIIKLDDKYFAVRDYVPKHKAWRCNHMSWNEHLGCWYCADDENYIIDNNGVLICKEYGYDLREVYPDEGAKI